MLEREQQPFGAFLAEDLAVAAEVGRPGPRGERDRRGAFEPRADRPGLGLGLGLIAQLTSDLSIAPGPGGGTEVRMSFNLRGD